MSHAFLTSLNGFFILRIMPGLLGIVFKVLIAWPHSPPQSQPLGLLIAYPHFQPSWTASFEGARPCLPLCLCALLSLCPQGHGLLSHLLNSCSSSKTQLKWHIPGGGAPGAHMTGLNVLAHWEPQEARNGNTMTCSWGSIAAHSASP